MTITWPPFSRGMSLHDRRDRRFVVDVVEDQEPGRVGAEPSKHGFGFGRVFSRLLLGQVENFGRGERGETGVERRLAVGADEQERRIVAGMRPGVFDREPRLADPAETVDHPNGESLRWRARERRAQLL